MRNIRLASMLLAILVVLSPSFGKSSARGQLEPVLASSPAAMETSVSVTDSKYVELLGQVGGSTRAVIVEGDYAIIGVGPHPVILDIADPATPSPVGQIGVHSGYVVDLALAGSDVYFAYGIYCLRIFEAFDPSSPLEVGFHPGLANGVAVVGDYAYVADFHKALFIIGLGDDWPSAVYLPLIMRWASCQRRAGFDLRLCRRVAPGLGERQGRGRSGNSAFPVAPRCWAGPRGCGELGTA